MEEALLNCLNTAKLSNCPPEQVNNFLPVGYAPHPWQWKFHSAARRADIQGGPVEVGCGGARGPGKSHAIFAQTALDDCQRQPNLKALFIRKTAITAKESFNDLIDRVLKNKVTYEISNNVISFPNGSRMLLGGFHNEDDIDKYVGVEYDIIVIEELNQLTEDKYEKLRGSLRTSKPNWRPRIYVSFNPGGIGHAFVKERFVLPHRLRDETTTAFIPSTFKDNPSLNVEYIDYLENLTGDLGRAWREGDFDLFAGQFFREFKETVHVCHPFQIPSDWKKFFAFDYGLNHPLSLGWYATSPDSVVYRYRELHGPGMSYTQAAEEFVAMTPEDEKLDYGVCDPAIWSKQGGSDDLLSGAEIFSKRVRELTGRDPRLIKADNNRIVGWGVVREYLRPYMVKENGEDQIRANLQIFSTCRQMIRTLPDMIHDDRIVEDMKKVDNDDCADELRYALMSRPRAAYTSKDRENAIFREAMKRKSLAQRLSTRLRFIR